MHESKTERVGSFFVHSKRSSLCVVLGLASCLTQAPPEPNAIEPLETDTPDVQPKAVDENNPLDLDAFSGTPIDGCENTGWNPTTATLTLNLGGETAVISAPQTYITVNGNGCIGTVGGVADKALSTSTVAKIVVNGSGGNDTVILDLAPGSFGTKIFSATGGITLNLDSGDDEVIVNGSSAANSYRAAKVSTSTDVVLELSGDKTADVLAVYTGNLTTTFSLGAGADTVTAAPTTAEINRFSATTLVIAPLETPLKVLGGSENDTITGGLGDDNLSGGSGNDTFRMQATDDGGDIYDGGDGIDFVDYSKRTTAQIIDVGPENPAIVGSVDLSLLSYGSSSELDGLTLKWDVDGGGEVSVTLASPAGPGDVAAQVNAAAGSTVAYLTGNNQLAFMTPTSQDNGGTIAVTSGSANDVLGILGGSSADSVADADDGLPEEADDVRATIENITGGPGNDSIFGGSARNILIGGLGDDILGGGASNSFTSAATADYLQGDAGADRFVMASFNSFCVVVGGVGIDTVDFSGRSDPLTLSLDNAANDGESGESLKLPTDIEIVLGGADNDVMVGGATNDTLRGGIGDDVISGGAGNDHLRGDAGNDTLNGGLGSDTADYSEYTSDLDITLCVSTTAVGAPSDCGDANDGDSMVETDQVANVEWVKGGSGNDTITASTIGATLEGGEGDDTLIGGISSDTLWGDGGNDSLDGGLGDDSLEGNVGDDLLNGGDGDDICVDDLEDASLPTNCEL